MFVDTPTQPEAMTTRAMTMIESRFIVGIPLKKVRDLEVTRCYSQRYFTPFFQVRYWARLSCIKSFENLASIMKLKHLLIVSIFASILLTVPSLHRPFFSRGEPREALVAVGMLRTGEWISPPAYDNTVPSKPPFTHWLMAAFSVVSGGVSEVTTRLPSALSVFLFIPLLVAAIFRRYGAARALAVGLILLTTPEWYRAMISCRVDTVLATSVAGALLALFSWYERGRVGVPWLVILLLSIATLTKGPVGFCLPGAIFALFLWVKGEVRTRSAGTLIINVVTIMLPVLGVASVWYLLGYLERGDISWRKCGLKTLSVSQGRWLATLTIIPLRTCGLPHF